MPLLSLFLSVLLFFLLLVRNTVLLVFFFYNNILLFHFMDRRLATSLANVFGSPTAGFDTKFSRVLRNLGGLFFYEHALLSKLTVQCCGPIVF